MGTGTGHKRGVDKAAQATEHILSDHESSGPGSSGGVSGEPAAIDPIRPLLMAAIYERLGQHVGPIS